MSKFVINQTQTTVLLFGGRTSIPIGGWAELQGSDLESSEVGDAVRRGWLKYSVKRPDEVQAFTPDLEFSEPAVKGSTEFPGKQS